MRALDELLATDDAWARVTAQAPASGAQIVPCVRRDGEAALVAAQVTTRSPMGAIAYHSAGLLVDHGWLRLLGAGGHRIGGGLVDWNASLGGQPLDPPLSDALVVAYDALGGFFAINGGHWEAPPGSIHYLAPDTWTWENLNLGYSAMLAWALSDQLERFYEGMRWPGWEREIEMLGPDESMTVYPFLGFQETPVGDRRRRPAPARELWTLVHKLARDAGHLPTGAAVEVKVTE